jgi:hypothetical protein
MGNSTAPDEAPLSSDSENPSAPPPFYRPIDWWTFAVTSPLILVVYWFTLAPDVTLNDAGELVTAGMWLGVPNPPGYPVWTLLTWFFIHLVPISNIAWRVALASAVEAALACGLCGLMASRFTGLLIEGMPSLKDVDHWKHSALCAVAGFVAATMLAFNRVVWSQAVIPEIYPLSMLSLVVMLLFLFRWTFAPERRRFLYWTAFLFGICVVNHQTLILAAIGLEIAIIAADPKLGRDILAVNVLCWLAGLCSERWRAILLFNSAAPSLLLIFNTVGVLSLAGLVAVIVKTKRFLTEWKPVLAIVGLWLAGLGFYILVPVASMANPPMNWGYPRTVEGFFHTISRGQYDRIYPADILHAPGAALSQIIRYFALAAEQFTPVCLAVALIPFAFFLKMRKPEKQWMIGMGGVFFCMALLLTVFLNPTRDRTTASLVKVFYLPSFVPIAIWIGCGFGVAGAWLAAKFPQMRMRWALAVFVAAPLVVAHRNWAASVQRDHFFGYWFGHDMFSPPYGIYPEMPRDAVLFGGTDPGRFCPTCMIFGESFTPPQERIDPQFDRRDVYIITQNALADNTYLDCIRAQYNRSAQTDPPFFQNLLPATNPNLSTNIRDPDPSKETTDQMPAPAGK